MATELTSDTRQVDELDRAVLAAQQRHGSCLEVRRARADLEHLRESVALLSELDGPQRSAEPKDQYRPGVLPGARGAGVPATDPPFVPVPDTPYDPSFWAGAEDEGIGGASATR